MAQGQMQASPVPAGIRYHMVFPPGWREFRTSIEFEEALVKLVTAEPRARGRADVVLMLRQKVHEMFEDLRRRGSLSFAIPAERGKAGVWPVSLIVTPLKTGPSGTLAEAVQRAARGCAVDTESVEDADWYFWNTSTRAKDAPELQSHGINMVVPRPLPDGSADPDPKAGLWLMYTYAELDQVKQDEVNEGLRQLGYAILGSFKWVPVQ